MYRALYRKWRPQRFEDVVGQRAIVTALKNQITANRVGHAYLFTGVRGTGKTTCAKIFAKAVNCLHPVNGDPCGECEICKGIDNGSILDVVEMDALRAGPRLPPQQKHACCPQCSARRRKQQYPRSENDLVHDTFPLCPVYVRRSKKVQKSPSHKIQCDGLFCQNAIASSSLPKGRPVAGSTGGRPVCPISAAFTLHTTALASTYFTFAVAAAPILS